MAAAMRLSSDSTALDWLVSLDSDDWQVMGEGAGQGGSWPGSALQAACHGLRTELWDSAVLGSARLGCRLAESGC